MNKDRIFAILRTLLSIGGALLLGHNIFGHAIDESLWQEITGGAMGAASIVLSVLDKTITLEMIQGALRQALSFVGGLLIASGKLTAENMNTWLGVITALVPFIYAGLSRKKTQAIDTGQVSITQLKQ